MNDGPAENASPPTADPGLSLLLVRALNQAFNRLLKLDPTASGKLEAMEGMKLKVHIDGPDLVFLLKVQDGRLQAEQGGSNSSDDAPGQPGRPAREQPAVSTLSATPGGFLSLMASRGQTTVGQLNIGGDVDTARRFQEFFTGLEPDWEEAMTRVFGDVIGFQAARVVSGGLNWLQQAGLALAGTTSEYLREESRQLIAEPEMEEFLDAVDDLRDDVDRLEARINQLSTNTRSGGSL